MRAPEVKNPVRCSGVPKKIQLNQLFRRNHARDHVAIVNWRCPQRSPSGTVENRKSPGMRAFGLRIIFHVVRALAAPRDAFPAPSHA
ncbi:hypothetical protein [Hoeflea ulvae]|uniref:Uncharacterized protein n=1 Tax=Hoeflea ulvae TaxID=2983764 RepID=A0ABT3YCF3_9HYPH|nr:hypothetical protein [Hoeflea ulvae]MCY0093561.1 hypothetical protein [Hoeflea ulvae]